MNNSDQCWRSSVFSANVGSCCAEVGACNLLSGRRLINSFVNESARKLPLRTFITMTTMVPTARKSYEVKVNTEGVIHY